MLRTIITKVLDKALKKANLYSLIFKDTIPFISVGVIHKLPVISYDLSPLLLRTDQKEFYERILKDEFFIFDQFRNIEEFKAIRQKDSPFWKCTWKDFDPKDYWEISRGIQWLPAYNYAKTIGEEKKVIKKLEEWIKKTPYLKGLDWAVPLDVVIRAINFLILYHFSKEEYLKTELWKHYTYLKKMLWISKNSIRNNHYLGELTAITLLGDFFQQKESQKNKKLLEKEFERQFYHDGVNEEQSIRYHKFALEFMIVAKVFLKINTPRLENAIDFLRYTEKPNQTWPSIGDDDLGCVLKNTKDLYDYDYCLSFQQNMETPLRQTKEFPEGGFFIHKNDEPKSQIIIKYGPHKWHAHADLFHIELTINNIPVLIDSGTYRYNNVPEERRYFRSTKAHNTLEYDGKDQTEQWTTFRWKKAAKVVNKKITEKNDKIIFSAEHTGYKKCGITHKRTIEFNKELTEIKVIDKVIGENNKETKIYWHLNPQLKSPLGRGGREADGVSKYTLETEKGTIGTIEITGTTTEISKTPYSEYYSKIETKETITAIKKRNTDIIITTFSFKK